MRHTGISFATACLIALAGCGPKEGDIYENKLTSERTEVQMVGTAREIEQHYSRSREAMRELEATSGIAPMDWPEPLIVSLPDEPSVAIGQPGFSMWTVISRDEFEKRYVRVH